VTPRQQQQHHKSVVLVADADHACCRAEHVTYPERLIECIHTNSYPHNTSNDECSDATHLLIEHPWMSTAKWSPQKAGANQETVIFSSRSGPTLNSVIRHTRG
jgi:hypothetical protein